MLAPEAIAKLTVAQQARHASRPLWPIAATAVAVWLGAAGCGDLIMRRRRAIPALSAFLAGVAFQDVWLFGLSGAAAQAGAVAFALQGLVLLIASGLVMLGRRALTRGWIARAIPVLTA